MFHSMKLKLAIRYAKKIVANEQPGFEKTIQLGKFKRFKVQMEKDEIAISWHVVIKHNNRPFWHYDKFHFNYKWEMIDNNSGKYPFSFTR